MARPEQRIALTIQTPCSFRPARIDTAAAHRSRTRCPMPNRTNRPCLARRRRRQHETARSLFHDAFLHELPVLLERHDAVVRAVARVDVAVLGEPHAADIRERLRAAGGPVTLVGAGVRVEDDDALVAAVGDVPSLAASSTATGLRGVQRIVAFGAVHLARRANLQDELSLFRELDHVRVGAAQREPLVRHALPALRQPPGRSASRCASTCSRPAPRPRRRQGAAAAAVVPVQPPRPPRRKSHQRRQTVTLAVDRDPGRVLRPLITLPGPPQLFSSVPADRTRDLRRAKAAFTGPRRQRRTLFVVLERFCSRLLTQM